MVASVNSLSSETSSFSLFLHTWLQLIISSVWNEKWIVRIDTIYRNLHEKRRASRIQSREGSSPRHETPQPIRRLPAMNLTPELMETDRDSRRFDQRWAYSRSPFGVLRPVSVSSQVLPRFWNRGILTCLYSKQIPSRARWTKTATLAQITSNQDPETEKL